MLRCFILYQQSIHKIHSNVFSVTQEVILSRLDATENGILQAVEQYLNSIMIPFLKKNNNYWGELSSKAHDQTRENFMNDLESFVAILGSAQDSLGERVELKKCDSYNLSKLQKAADYQAAANSTQDLETIEAIMAVWIKQIEQVSVAEGHVA